MIHTVLIVDSSEKRRAIICEHLRQAGMFHVLQASPFDASLDTVLNETVHLCLFYEPESSEAVLDTLFSLSLPLMAYAPADRFLSMTRLIERGVMDCFSWPLTDAVCRFELVRRIKMALELTEKNAQITYLKQHDTLTKLYNRHFLTREMTRHNTIDQLPQSVIILDIDGLKRINDAFGHDTGDEVLSCVAAMLRECLCQEDLLGRWGSDAFIVFLPRTDYTSAMDIAERIHQCSESWPQKKEWNVTVSLGVSERKEQDEPIMKTIAQANDRMIKHKLLVHNSYRNKILRSLQHLLFEKSTETSDHVARMAQMSSQIGKAMNLDPDLIDSMRLLAFLHDIGKIIVPDPILTKPGRLNEAEWLEIKKHPESGYHILQGMPELSDIAAGVYAHHEHWDGNGYPRGLKGKDIPLIARVIAVTDSFDAITHDRLYRNKRSVAEAIDELKRCAGTQFDPTIVSVFVRVLSALPTEDQPSHASVSSMNILMPE